MLPKRKLEEASHGFSDQMVKANKRKANRKVTAKDDNVGFDLGLNASIGRLDNQLLADLIAQKIKKANPNLSILELEEKQIAVNAIRDTSEWPLDRSLHQMPTFLEQFGSGKAELANASLRHGAPHTLVITSAGLQAANITRTLRVFETPNAVVAKLFAKHIKLKKASEYVKKTRIGIGVGTPARIIDLLGAGALSSDELERIVVDSSHIDQKQRGILDMQETLRPLLELLNKPAFKERYGSCSHRLDLIFY